MIVSRSRNFAFIHIHKTAGESVSAALAPHLRRGDILIEDDPRTEWRKRTIPTYRAARHLRKHSPARDVAAFVGSEWQNLLRFAVVRDPAARVRSLYHYLWTVRDLTESSIARRAWYRTPFGASANPMKWEGMRALNQTSSFSEFLRHPALQNAPGMRPQVDMLSDEDGTLLVNRVLHLETISAGFSQLCESLGFEQPMSLPRKNSSSSAHHPSTVLKSEDREFIASRFASDYVTFGYTPDS